MFIAVISAAKVKRFEVDFALMKAIIDAQGLVKRFGKIEVLKGVDLKIPAGQLTTISGASGAGKTTLLQILGTLDRADEGSLFIADQDVKQISGRALSAFRNQQIGFIFQFHRLLPEFTAGENVLMPA